MSPDPTKARGKRSFAVEDLPEDVIREIARAEMSSRFEKLDCLIDGGEVGVSRE